MSASRVASGGAPTLNSERCVGIQPLKRIYDDASGESLYVAEGGVECEPRVVLGSRYLPVNMLRLRLANRRQSFQMPNGLASIQAGMYYSIERLRKRLRVGRRPPSAVIPKSRRMSTRTMPSIS